MQVLLGAQQISTGVPGVKAAWADTLDRDFFYCQNVRPMRLIEVGLDHCQGQVSTQIKGLHHVCAK